jgi:hypothetical protein
MCIARASVSLLVDGGDDSAYTRGFQTTDPCQKKRKKSTINENNDKKGKNWFPYKKFCMGVHRQSPIQNFLYGSQFFVLFRFISKFLKKTPPHPSLASKLYGDFPIFPYKIALAFA